MVSEQDTVGHNPIKANNMVVTMMIGYNRPEYIFSAEQPTKELFTIYTYNNILYYNNSMMYTPMYNI